MNHRDLDNHITGHYGEDFMEDFEQDPPVRTDKDDYFLQLAFSIATRSTCIRRAVGCVLVNYAGNITATGYNGVPRGQPHCNEEVQCPGAVSEPGVNLEGCWAVHAEQNALMQCANVNDIHTAYVTVSPCIHCTKMLLNTSCRRIVCGALYSHEYAQKLWTDARHGILLRERFESNEQVIERLNLQVDLLKTRVHDLDREQL